MDTMDRLLPIDQSPHLDLARQELREAAVRPMLQKPGPATGC